METFCNIGLEYMKVKTTVNSITGENKTADFRPPLSKLVKTQ